MIEFLLGLAVGAVVALMYCYYFDIRRARLDEVWQEGFDMGRDWEGPW